MIREPKKPLRLGMVGGGKGAFIGEVHCAAARLDETWTIVASARSEVKCTEVSWSKS